MYIAVYVHVYTRTCTHSYRLWKFLEYSFSTLSYIPRPYAVYDRVYRQALILPLIECSDEWCAIYICNLICLSHSLGDLFRSIISPPSVSVAGSHGCWLRPVNPRQLQRPLPTCPAPHSRGGTTVSLLSLLTLPATANARPLLLILTRTLINISYTIVMTIT